MTSEHIWDLIINISAGAILTLLFFALREFVFRLPDLNGSWQIETTTNATAFKAYEKMKLRWCGFIWQTGHQLQGTAEKIEEQTTGGDTVKFTGAARIRSRFEGYVTKRYFPFMKDKIIIHVIETGAIRECTTIYRLTYSKKGELLGTFTSSAADSSGTARWTLKE